MDRGEPRGGVFVSVNTGTSSARGERFLSPWKRIPGTPTGTPMHTYIGYGSNVGRDWKKKKMLQRRREGPRSLTRARTRVFHFSANVARTEGLGTDRDGGKRTIKSVESWGEVSSEVWTSTRYRSIRERWNIWWVSCEYLWKSASGKFFSNSIFQPVFSQPESRKIEISILI